jgi:hypothetical protein
MVFPPYLRLIKIILMGCIRYPKAGNRSSLKVRIKKLRERRPAAWQGFINPA